MRKRLKSYISQKADERLGSLPDFLIIGAQKCGTGSLYHLLVRHPDVIAATKKEVHYFDKNFDKELSWYRAHFPALSPEDRKSTVTGEASPYYLFHPLAAERVSEVVPNVRLMVLLRNPVDRAYSHYQARIRREHESLSFEEALEADLQMIEEGVGHRRASYLTRGIYVDQIQHWHGFFDPDRMLVLKSEDFFADMTGGLGQVLDFLDLAAWEPRNPGSRNKGGYKETMKPATREWLENYYEPHNQRLYDYLGFDFGW